MYSEGAPVHTFPYIRAPTVLHIPIVCNIERYKRFSKFGSYSVVDAVDIFHFLFNAYFWVSALSVRLDSGPDSNKIGEELQTSCRIILLLFPHISLLIRTDCKWIILVAVVAQ